MKSVLTLLAFLFASTAYGQRCECGSGCPCAGACDCFLASADEPAKTTETSATYYADEAAALAANKPLVAFVGIPKRELPGTATTYANSVPGYPRPCVIVSAPHKGCMCEVKVLPAEATPPEIVAALPKPVKMGNGSVGWWEPYPFPFDPYHPYDPRYAVPPGYNAAAANRALTGRVFGQPLFIRGGNCANGQCGR